jgi:antitoxin HicB
MLYPIELTPDTNGTLAVSFPDLPWVHTFGDDEADAIVQAKDALDTALEYLIRERQRIPLPSRRMGAAVAVSALVAAKIALHNRMVEHRVTKAEMKRRLHVHGPQVDRLLDPKHVSRFDEVERAFGAVGLRLVVKAEHVDVPAGVIEAQRQATPRRRLAAKKR